jgi:hypothetical protein
LLEYVQDGERLSSRLLGGFCSALFPGVIGVPECIKIAKQGAPEDTRFGGGLGQSFEYEIVQECPTSEVGSLLAGLLELGREAPLIRMDDEDLVSERFA